MDLKPQWEKDRYVLRPAAASDAESYYAQNYNPLDPEVARLTGCKAHFTQEEVVSFFLKSLEDPDCRFFLILSPDGRVIGGSVINEIDWELRRANFRIAIFHTGAQGRGIGTWAVEKTRDYAFEALKLHRLELDVYSFNPRAERAYAKAGFRREGVLRDAVLDGDHYADDILMALPEEDWRSLRSSQGS